MSKPLVLVVSNKDERVDHFSLWLDAYDLMYASTSEEAYNVFLNNSYKIRVVLLDLVLPDYSGIDLMLRLKKVSALSEIIIVSDKHDIHLAVDCVKKGAFDYLPYPFSQHKLIQTISNAIDNLDYHSFDSLSNNVVDKDIQDKISFLHEIVITKRLYERSLTRQEFLQLLDNKSYSLLDIQADIIKAIDDRYQAFNLPNILIMEEDFVYRNLTKAFLHERFDVILSGNVNEAKQYIESYDRLDILILELFLPDGSAFDLIPLIQKQHPDAEIIVLTAYEHISEATKLIRLGVNHFLNKPLLKHQLIDVVYNAMEEKYKTKIIPEVTKKMIEHKLSDEDKYSLLKDLIDSRKMSEKPLLMKDLYSYFPELKQLCLPDSLSISNIDLKKDIACFVNELRVGLVQDTQYVSV